MPRRILRSRAYQLAHEPESLVSTTRSGKEWRQFPGHALRIDGLCGLPGSLLKGFPPILNVILDRLSPFAGLLLPKSRQKCAQRLGGIAHEPTSMGKRIDSMLAPISI